MCVRTYTPIWIRDIFYPIFSSSAEWTLSNVIVQIFKDCFILRKTSHWRATCCKAAQHWNIWWVCNRLCHYNPKAANRNTLWILFVIDFADGLWGPAEGDNCYFVSTICTCMGWPPYLTDAQRAWSRIPQPPARRRAAPTWKCPVASGRCYFLQHPFITGTLVWKINDKTHQPT